MSIVLDASALIAYLREEPGADKVLRHLTAGNTAISTVNLTEVLSKAADGGMTIDGAHRLIADLGIDVTDFTAEHAVRASLLRPLTRSLGLSLGDRACLALAQSLGATALTADQAWSNLNLNINIEMIR